MPMQLCFPYPFLFLNQIPNSSQTNETMFFLPLPTFNVKNNLTLNQENYVNNKITKNPDKADLQRLVLLLTDQPLLVIIKK